MADITPVVTVPANKSLMLVDSRYRNIEDTPYDVNVTLSSALTARRLYYQTLSWSSPFFTHNLTNNEIRIQFRDDDNPGRVYVAYMMPWTMTKEYSGSTAELEPGSYGMFLYETLTDLRREGVNLMRHEVKVGGGHDILAYVDYNYSRGFTFYFEDITTRQATPFRVLDCSWIEKGHNIHGFGVFDPVTNKFRPALYSQPTDDQWMYSYTSDTTPTLLYTRFVTVSSKELTKDRVVQPFTASGAPNYNAQMAIFATNVQNSGVYHQDYEINDTSIISVRPGTQHQFFRITVTDEFGDVLLPGNPIAAFFQDTSIPLEIFHDYFDRSLNYYTHDLVNYLCFGKTISILSEEQRSILDDLGLDPETTSASTFFGYYRDAAFSPDPLHNYVKFRDIDRNVLLHQTDTYFYYRAWEKIGRSDLVPIVGAKDMQKAPLKDTNYTEGRFVMYPNIKTPFFAYVDWGTLTIFVNTPQTVSDPYELSIYLDINFENFDLQLITTERIGCNANPITFYSYGTHDIQAGNIKTSNISVPPYTYRIGIQYHTVLKVPVGTTDENFVCNIYYNNTIVNFSQNNVQHDPPQPPVQPSEILTVDLPKENYPYGPYNATVLNDDLLHQIEVINAF